MRIEWAPDAIEDARRVTSFLMKRSPGTAHRAWERIVAAADALADSPGMGWEDGECRVLLVPFGASAYVIRYRVIEDTVVIARVWHGREGRY